GPSQTNYEDVDRSLRIVRALDSLGDSPTVTVMKHVNACGVAKKSDILEAFKDAWDCDARAAYGGTVTFNREVTAELVQAAYAHIKSGNPAAFIDVMAAPSYTPEAMEHIKKNVRAFRYDESVHQSINPFQKGPLDYKALSDGRIIVSEAYVEAVRTGGDLKTVTARAPTDEEVKDLLFAWHVCANTRSNGIVFARNQATVSIGTGKQERIGAIEDAVLKAEAKAVYRQEKPGESLRGAVIASDGFIPNTDNIPPLQKYGVRAIVQPGGSERDSAIIEACNAADIAMVFTNWRCFSHH
ncbi:MAG TPA: hypothetical protein VLJ21_03170, partial [Candidatus Binatia bacterium]|nr:hypothetical protein [Candidatus Binatia bacterium]